MQNLHAGASTILLDSDSDTTITEGNNILLRNCQPASRTVIKEDLLVYVSVYSYTG